VLSGSIAVDYLQQKKDQGSLRLALVFCLYLETNSSPWCLEKAGAFRKGM